MSLQTMRPEPNWEPSETEQQAIESIRPLRGRLSFKVWGGDWCGDSQTLLPPFAAALSRAGIDPETVKQYSVQKQPDGSKVGPFVDTYGIEYVPTIVIEEENEEIARFVESGEEPPIVSLVADLRTRLPRD